jgi:hypothetical protein
MYIESVPNRGSPPAILLRESFRQDGRVRKRTLANLSAWPTALVEGFRTLLKGGVAVAADGIRIRRALPHGHAVAVLGTLRAIGLDRLLGKPADKRLVPLAMALIANRLIAPASKLATARELAVATAGSSLGRLLRLGAVDEVELYRALDWLGARQSAIETALAHRHLTAGALVLYDVSSSWLEGRCCELARFGHSRDGKKGKLQIAHLLGLLIRHKATADQAMGQQIGQPGGVVDVGLAPRHVLNVCGVGQHQREIGVVQDVPDRLPVDAGRFHRDVSAFLGREPVRQRQQFRGGCLEGAHFALDRAVDHVSHAGDYCVLTHVEAGAMRIQNFHLPS